MAPRKKPPIWFYEWLTNDYHHLQTDVTIGKYIGGFVVVGLITVLVKLFLG